MSGILDMSEGLVTTSMKTEFKQLIKEAKAADDSYNMAIETELKILNKIIK